MDLVRMPGRIMLNSWEITDVLSELVASIIKAVKDIGRYLWNSLMILLLTEITITGGGALLRNPSGYH